MVSILDKPQDGRPWYKRWTVLGASALAAITVLEANGLIPAGISDSLVTSAKTGSGFVASLGIYRQFTGIGVPKAPVEE